MVATPKRLAHLVKAKQIDLSSVQFLILDEADKLFESGFVSHIDAIIHACSNPSIVSLLPLAIIVTLVLQCTFSAFVLTILIPKWASHTVLQAASSLEVLEGLFAMENSP